MIKNYLTVCLLALFSALGITHLSAQDTKESKKVVVIEKVVDENGKTTETKVVKEGAEAEKYLKEHGELIEKKAYKMVILDDEGNEDVIEWNGEGEMPEELKSMMEKHNLESHINVEVEIEDGDDNEKEIKIIKMVDGEKEVIEFEVDGDEMPEDIQKMLEEKGLNVIVMDEDDHDVRVFMDKDVKGNSNKAQLGVFIESVDNGAKVIGIMEGSAAEKAGLKEGDIITRVNDTPVSSIESLLDALSVFKPSDIAIIETQRDGERKAFEVVLQERKDNFEHKSWNKVIEIHEEHEDDGDDDDEIIIIKKKVKVKKDKK